MSDVPVIELDGPEPRRAQTRAQTSYEIQEDANGELQIIGADQETNERLLYFVQARNLMARRQARRNPPTVYIPYIQRPDYKYMFSLEGHTDTVTSVKFSWSGKFLATASEDRTIRIYEFPEVKFLLKIEPGHTGGINEIAWKPSNKEVASASNDGTLKMSSIKTGECLLTFVGHTAEVLCCVFNTKKKLLMSGSRDQTVRLWNTDSGECVKVVNLDQGPILKIDFNCTGEQFVSSTSEGFISIRETDTINDIQILKTEDLNNATPPAPFVKFMPNSEYLIVGTAGFHIGIVTIENRCQTKTYSAPSDQNDCLSPSYSHVGYKRIVCGSEEGSIYIWNLMAERVVQTLSGMHKTAVTATDNHPHMNMIASGGRQPDPVVRLWRSTLRNKFTKSFDSQRKVFTPSAP